MKYSLSLATSNVCNNHCRYCYQDRKETNIMTYDQMIKILETFNSRSLNWDKHVKFFGGEPMLLSNIIKEVVDQCREYTYTIITNGYFLNNDDYLKYMIGLERVAFIFSLEANAKTHAFFRNPNDNYNLMKERIIELSKDYNVMINMSMNKIMFDNYEESYKNIKDLLESGIMISFYSIKGEDGFKDAEEFKKVLHSVKENCPELIKEITKKYTKFSDAQFLCTFESCISVNSKFECYSCSWDNFKYGNILHGENIDKIENKLNERLALNHISFHNCSTCEVPVGVCQISCLPFILETINSKGIEKMNDFCNKQKILYNLGGLMNE